MLIAAYSLNALLMLLIPILLGIFLARKYHLSWRLFLFGGVAFILSQVIHLPLNLALARLIPEVGSGGVVWMQALTFGFTAAICEESARYLILRYGLKDARSWKSALMYGAGHGGFEAMILGVLSGLAIVNMMALKDNPALLAAVPAEQADLVKQQVAAFWSTPWYLALMGAVERASALTIQISLAVIVMQAFLRKNKSWLLIAIGWHWLVDAASVLSVSHFSIPVTELIIGGLALISLAIIFYFKSTASEDATPPRDAAPREPLPVEALNFSPPTDKLDDSRYRSA